MSPTDEYVRRRIVPFARDDVPWGNIIKWMWRVLLVLVPIVVATCLVNLARRSRHHQLPDQPLPRLLPDWTGWAIFAIVVVFTIPRNIPYEPFLFLAPG